VDGQLHVRLTGEIIGSEEMSEWKDYFKGFIVVRSWNGYRDSTILYT